MEQTDPTDLLVKTSASRSTSLTIYLLPEKEQQIVAGRTTLRLEPVAA
jgi:hypothetical protein